MVDCVSALYIDPEGPYPKLVQDCWDEVRDAKLYNGPNPVIAHPPCGPWGPMRTLCTKQDPTCGPAAVQSVQKFGGVLEHPKNSSLFEICSLPLPGESDDFGTTYYVEQVSWGHTCVKPTWLYIVGVPDELVRSGIRTGGIPTHRVTSGPRYQHLPSASPKMRRLTTPAFAEWLVSLAKVAS